MNTYSFFSIRTAMLLILFSSITMSQDRTEITSRFLELARIQSVTGYEDDLHNYLKENLPEHGTVLSDNMGNLIVLFGNEDPELIIVAGIDEPGYVISEIRKDGYMRVQPASRVQNPLFNQFHEGHLVDIHTEHGVVRGIVSIPSSHITRNKPPIMPLDQFIIDVGAENETDVASLGINILDPAAAVKDIAMLQGNRAAGPLLSRKFPAFVLLELIREVGGGLEKPVAFAWTAKSSNRNSGAARLANEYAPSHVLLIKSFQQETARGSETVSNPVSEPGSGVLVPNNLVTLQSESTLARSIIASANARGISLTPSTTGRIAEEQNFQSAHVLPLSIPVQYPESLVESIDMDDLSELITLLKEVLNGY
ncbi:hypothetical protein ACFL6I_17495 [candidate division KSB1 bacterium]